MSRKPIPHGLNPKGFLTEKQCKQLKIPATFINFNYHKWCSIEDLVEVSQKNDLPSLQAYSASCKSFLQNNKASFNRKYEKAHLIKEAKEMGYNNALKETIIVKPSQQETETNEDEQEQLPLNDINEAEAYKKVVLTLYKSAKDIVLKRQNAKNMSIYEYKIMASGFSGILDLVDKSDESCQAQYFTTRST
ncbi:hypothetical protein BDC45DRAFT_568265 [Circinella umbellata]|nr:hypothetical protein BDC45DRAFT_568265 [Circinella umbellata]